MKGVLNCRVGWEVAALLALLVAGPAVAQDACGICGAPLTSKSVAVTDWETNKEHRYHDISCAVRDMAARFVWSRAAAQSALSGQRVTLSRINTTWRAEPEEAVFVRLAPTAPGCDNTLVFASTGEFSKYRQSAKNDIPADARPVLLAHLPAQLASLAPQAANQPPRRVEPEADAGHSPPAFADVPLDHWAAKFVEKASALGLMRGYPDGTFRGERPLTRYEMAAILAALAEQGFLETRVQSGAEEGAALAAPPSGRATAASRARARQAPLKESSGPAAEAGAQPLQLDRLIEIALEENRELEALRGKIKADRAKVPQARSLPDPMFGIMFDNVLRPDGGIALEARQMIPWPGKLRLMSQAAALSADRTVTQYTEKAYQVVAEVKKAYYDLYFIEKSIEIALENKSVLADFVKIAEAKYAVGAGIQQDVLRAQVAQSRILNDLLMLEQERTAARARLNALLNRPPDAPLGAAAALTRHKVTLGQRALEEIAFQHRAMLRGMRLMVAESETMQSLARRELKPDLEARLGLAPGQGMGSGGTRVTGMIMLQLPLYRRTKQEKAIEQRAAELRSAESDYEAQKTMVSAMIRDTLAILERAGQAGELYRSGIIPQAQLSLESARAGYEVNKVDFLTLLDGQMALYDALREYYRAVADYEKAAAELERTIGTPLEASEVEPS